MTSPRHHSIGTVTDLHPVRPGTSAALTARTIDATVHPPMVRAQEAVAAFIPRVEAPIQAFGSPILIGMVGATLVLFWIAHRVRFRPSGLVFSATLMMMLTSFHPWTNPVPADEQATAMAGDARGQAANVDIEPQIDIEPQMVAPPAIDEDARPASPEFEISPELMAKVMSSTELMRMNREMMRHDREELRASLQELAIQVRKEARRNARRYYSGW
jgi:hypothetical protein